MTAGGHFQPDVILLLIPQFFLMILHLSDAYDKKHFLKIPFQTLSYVL